VRSSKKSNFAIQSTMVFKGGYLGLRQSPLSSQWNEKNIWAL